MIRKDQLVSELRSLLEEYDNLLEQYASLLKRRELLAKEHREQEYRLEEAEATAILSGLDGKNEQTRKAQLRSKLAPLHESLREATEKLKSLDSSLELIRLRYQHTREKIMTLRSMLRSLYGGEED